MLLRGLCVRKQVMASWRPRKQRLRVFICECACVKFDYVSRRSLSVPSNQHGIDGVGMRKKCVKLIYCIAEAKRAVDRARVRKTCFMTLQQDAAGKRLICQFTSSDSELVPSRGLFGLRHYLEEGSGSSGVASAAKAMVADFCTPFQSPPYLTEKAAQKIRPEQNIDADLYDRIRMHVRIFGTDAAQDEIAAGRALRESFFPKLQVQQRDTTHASRRTRICRRGWGQGTLTCDRSAHDTQFIPCFPHLEAQWMPFHTPYSVQVYTPLVRNSGQDPPPTKNNN